MSREPERRRAIGHERKPIPAPLACGLIRSKAKMNCGNVGERERHNIAPLRHMREGPDGSPSRPRDPKPEV